MRRKNEELLKNQVVTSLLDFMEAYNRMIPSDYPHATVQALHKFQATHSMLFKFNDQWSIDRHRKRLMDWLPSYLQTK